MPVLPLSPPAQQEPCTDAGVCVAYTSVAFPVQMAYFLASDGTVRNPDSCIISWNKRRSLDDEK